MNTYHIGDEDFTNSQLYQSFMDENPSVGNLRIRSFAASEAVPIKGLKVIVSTIFDNNKIIFFEGETNESGLIEKITLPTPTLDINNLETPKTIIYDIEATYQPDNIKALYKVNMYEGICVVQHINVVPELRMGIGGN